LLANQIQLFHSTLRKQNRRSGSGRIEQSLH
jgi:hypothetical protein